MHVAAGVAPVAAMLSAQVVTETALAKMRKPGVESGRSALKRQLFAYGLIVLNPSAVCTIAN
jgi:hypothetical protein